MRHYLFVKHFFDMHPKTVKRVVSLKAIASIIKNIDNPYDFVHCVYLLTKCKPFLLNEMHVRILLEKLNIITTFKLFFFTYMNNPLLVCIMICEILHNLVPAHQKNRINLE